MSRLTRPELAPASWVMASLSWPGVLGHGGRHRVVLLDELLYLAGVGIERAGQLGQRAVELTEVVPLRRQQLHRPRRRRDELVEVRPLAVEIGGEIGHQVAHRVGVDGVERALQFLQQLVRRDRDRSVILRDGRARGQEWPSRVARVQVDVRRAQQLWRHQRREGRRGNPGPLVHRQRDIDLVADVLHVRDGSHLHSEDVDGRPGEQPGGARVDDLYRVGGLPLRHLETDDHDGNQDNAGHQEAEGLRREHGAQRPIIPPPATAG